MPPLNSAPFNSAPFNGSLFTPAEPVALRSRRIWEPDPAIGVDLRLDATQDLAVTPSGDLDLIGNAVPMENVWQATALRLLSTLGTYVFQPVADVYGTELRKSIEEPITSALSGRLEAEITKTVLADPRVARIERLSITQATDWVGFQIELAFSTFSGQTVGGQIPIGVN